VKRSLAAARGLAVLAIVIACGGGGHQIPRDRVTSPGEALFNGYAKHGINCFECHDGTGRGTTWGPALATRVPSLTDDQIAATIRTGKGKMPAFGTKLNDAEVGQVVTWLREKFGSGVGPH